MRTPALLAFVVLWSGNLFAQLTFERIYLATGAFKMNLTELGSQNLMCAIAATGTGVSLMNPEGDLIQSKYYWGDTVLNISSVRKFSDNEFYFVSGYWKDTCTVEGFGVVNRVYPVIGRMDSLGNVLSFRHYVLNAPVCSNFPSDLEITADKSVITWGRETAFFGLKADSTGVPIWAKRFSNAGGFQFIKELPSGDLLAGINMDTAGAVVARLDANGNFLWCKSYVRPGGMIHDCVIESDGSFVITGVTDSVGSTNAFEPLPLNFHPKLFMMKLNGAGDVQWCKGYDNGSDLWYGRSGSQIARAQDGNYVVLANLGVAGFNRPFRPFLMKTDMNGDTLWTHSYGVEGYRYDTYDLLSSSDGGFLFDGIIYGNLPEMWSGAPYIFKADSLGQVPCSEQGYTVQVLDLFPNDSSFVLNSIDGALMLPAYVGDTIFDPVTVYDGCIITSVLQPRATARPRVYPNPNTGRFTVEFADPLMAESYYSVYDALGKLLYQRPLPTGATLEEVDLSRYGRGTYAIKFTSPDGVCYERVVLE